mgnify:CR=1 FL=1
MLEALTPQPQDKILVLMAQFREDPRSTKVDLGVGVYKDATGLTPVMRAVKTAEKQLWELEVTKTYTGLAGEPAFHAAMTNLILGPGFADRAAVAATPGGTGAIRQALELIRMAAPDATVWISNPTWPNHPSIIKLADEGDPKSGIDVNDVRARERSGRVRRSDEITVFFQESPSRSDSATRFESSHGGQVFIDVPLLIGANDPVHVSAHERRIDGLGAEPQLPHQRLDDLLALGPARRVNRGPEGFVGAVFAPCLGDGFKLNIGGVNTTL